MNIECRDVWYRYDRGADTWALSGVSLRIGPSERIIVTGPAGSGKTTLMQMLDALVLPERGDVLYDGESVHRLARKRLLPAVRRRCGVLFQFPEEQFFHEKAYDELTFAVRNFSRPDESTLEAKARSVTQALGLDLNLLRACSPFEMSTGERRRLALASALMMDPELLMLDEPTCGLDASGRRELVRILESLGRTSVVVVTHNIEDFLPIAGTILCLDRGAVVFHGTREEFLGDAGLAERIPGVVPLVVRVQQWLDAHGVAPEEALWDMEGLVGYLRRICGLKREG